MLLVPRQLRRYGMTGDVPYYGGRFTPAQAYAASHPSTPRAPGVPSDQAVLYARSAVPGTPPPDPAAGNQAALQQLLAGGVITQAEYDQLRTRAAR
ncbi:SHOCT domain-containing protein [Microlunatus ginsengisoli]|uniref:SHOCT domain-containing protein n=1 Tax=Microlunatus ginsengisoli TaxID=363863 RepID=A0ABP6ZCB9_9ACTN